MDNAAPTLAPAIISAIAAGIMVILSIVGLLRSLKHDRQDELAVAKTTIRRLEDELTKCKEDNLRLLTQLVTRGREV